MNDQTTKTEKIKAILVTNAVCTGKGSDRWKGVSGITKKVLAQCEALDPTARLLVPSHTGYLGQEYKEAVHTAYGWKHRQINVPDFKIVGVV